MKALKPLIIPERLASKRPGLNNANKIAYKNELNKVINKQMKV